MLAGFAVKIVVNIRRSQYFSTFLKNKCKSKTQIMKINNMYLLKNLTKNAITAITVSFLKFDRLKYCLSLTNSLSAHLRLQRTSLETTECRKGTGETDFSERKNPDLWKKILFTG